MSSTTTQGEKPVREQWDLTIRLVPFGNRLSSNHHCSIVDFAKTFYKANNRLSHTELAESVVDFWRREVRYFYKNDIFEHEDVLRQSQSPLFNDYMLSKLDAEQRALLKKVDPVTGAIIEEVRDKDSFYRVTGRASAVNSHADPGTIAVGNCTYNAIIVPHIGLQALADLDFLTVAKDVIAVNRNIVFNERLVKQLWCQTIANVYGFAHENERARKISSCLNVPVHDLLSNKDDPPAGGPREEIGSSSDAASARGH